MTQRSQNVNEMCIWCIKFQNPKLLFSTHKFKRLQSTTFLLPTIIHAFFLSFFPFINKMNICSNLQKKENILTNRCTLVSILGSRLGFKDKELLQKASKIYINIYNATQIKCSTLRLSCPSSRCSVSGKQVIKSFKVMFFFSQNSSCMMFLIFEFLQ